MFKNNNNAVNALFNDQKLSQHKQAYRCHFGICNGTFFIDYESWFMTHNVFSWFWWFILISTYFFRTYISLWRHASTWVHFGKWTRNVNLKIPTKRGQTSIWICPLVQFAFNVHTTLTPTIRAGQKWPTVLISCI